MVSITAVAILLAALFTAIHYRLSEHLKYINITTLLFWQYLLSIPIMYIYFSSSFNITDIPNISGYGWLYILSIVLIIGIGAYAFMIRSSKEIGALQTGSIDYLEPIIGVLLAFVLFGENLSTTQLIGWGMILFAIFNIKKIR